MTSLRLSQLLSGAAAGARGARAGGGIAGSGG